MARPILARIAIVVAAVAIVIVPVTMLVSMAKPGTIGAPVGPTDDERLVLLAERRSLEWGYLLQQNPTLSRPATSVVAVLSGDDWARAVEGCLAVATIDFADSSGATSIQGSLDGHAFDTSDVAYQVCRDSYPKRDDVDNLMNDAQIGYLYDYYSTWVVPCLAKLGRVSLRTPTRDAFITNFAAEGWPPYVGHTVNGVTSSPVNPYRMCPVEPPRLSDPAKD